MVYHEMRDDHRNKLIQELEYENNVISTTKDIIIVVRNQYEHIKKCLDSIQANTQNYRLFIWDNGSDQKTKSLLVTYKPTLLVTSKENLGFVIPNNYLISFTNSSYIILLNSDTIVCQGWDNALIGLLQARTDIGIAGYQGMLVNEDGLGVYPKSGDEIDYVEGWCMCLSQDTYNKIGLFDPNFKLAYCEDCDLCLRVIDAGYKVYGMHLRYVSHVGSVTTKSVNAEMNITKAFIHNQMYMRNKWSNYLKHKRVLNGKT